ncbi:LytTR family DNA-binding domain-containing protein [Gluconacetobacter tumulisoli]|nr:LytTR family DNA-binding domain-containing protein [Gluconacetobacter tumulisoli]
MRASLKTVEQALAPHGLMRTHRSWLVNAAHVREIVPTGSGDFDLAIGDGGIVPLSRRYPDTLERLRSI